MKIFKKLLPVIVGIALIVVIAVTLVVVNVVTNRTPVLSNGDDTYVKFGNLTVTKQELYDALKMDYSVAELNRIIDNHLYKDEVSKVTNEELETYIENDIFGEDFEGDKQEQWDEVIESLIVTGVLTKADAENNDYTDKTSAVWTKVKDYYRIEVAKQKWAKAEIVKRLQAERTEEGKTGLFDDEDIEEYFEDNYGKTTTGLVIPFTSAAAAKAMMEKYGINVDASKSSSSTNQLAGWVKSSFDSENNQYPTVNDYLTPDEVIAIFVNMYNEVLAYTNGGEDIITSDLVEETVSETKTLQLVKIALDELVKNNKSVKGDLQLPLSLSIPGTETQVTFKWEAVEDTNFALDAETGAVTVTRAAVKSTHTVKGTVTFGNTTEDLSYTFEVVATSTEDSEKAEAVDLAAKLATDYTFAVMHDYKFNLTNELANGHAQFVWEASDDSDLGKFLSSSSTKLELLDDASKFFESYTIKAESVGSYYCLMIKLNESDEVKLEDVKAEIEEKMTEALYSKSEGDNAYLTEMFFIRRKESNLKIYDKFIEALYSYDYKTFYSSTLGETDFEEYKTSKKTKKDVVASVDGLTITPEDLYKVLEDKYGATYVKTFIDQYLIINSKFNTYYNPWNEEVYDKAYIKSLIKSDINSFKQNFELDYFTYDYLSYYGFIPNFPASYGWKNFIHDYFGADSEKDLLVSKNFGGTIYSDVLTDYRESLYTFDDIKKAMEEAKAEAWNVDVMNLIISVDYDLDGEPDTKIVESNKETTTKENWTAEQVELAEELAELIMTRYDEVLATGSISDKLNQVVTIYNDANYEVVENPTTLEEEFGKYKLAGLHIKFEKSANYNQSSSLVEEFLDAMSVMWNYANDNGLVYDEEAAEENSHYANPIVSALKYNVANNDGNYAFATSYGFHAIAVEKAYEASELPTEDEIKLYDAANKLSTAQSNLTSAQSNLESASGNESAVTSYKEQVKQYEAEVEECVEEVKALLEKLGLEGFDEEKNTYTIDEKIKAKCTAWYDSAKTETESYIVESELIDVIKAAIANSEITFAEGFDMSQFEYYLQYLLDAYQETEE